MAMPEKETIERAREDKREGKAPSTQETLEASLASLYESAEKRRSQRRVQASTFPPGSRRREEEVRCFTFTLSKESREDTEEVSGPATRLHH